MYSDKKQKKTGRWILLGIILIAAVSLTAVLLFGGGSRSAEGAGAIREAVRRGALQCYAVEGVYPPDLDYLREHYGVQVNADDYYVVYRAFSSNLPPEIRVIPKGS